MAKFCGMGGAWSGPERDADESVPVAELFEIVLSCGVWLWAIRRLDRFEFYQATAGLRGSQDLFQVKAIRFFEQRKLGVFSHSKGPRAGRSTAQGSKVPRGVPKKVPEQGSQARFAKVRRKRLL